MIKEMNSHRRVRGSLGHTAACSIPIKIQFNAVENKPSHWATSVTKWTDDGEMTALTIRLRFRKLQVNEPSDQFGVWFSGFTAFRPLNCFLRLWFVKRLKLVWCCFRVVQSERQIRTASFSFKLARCFQKWCSVWWGSTSVEVVVSSLTERRSLKYFFAFCERCNSLHQTATRRVSTDFGKHLVLPKNIIS